MNWITSNYRTLSLFVGWLNVVLSILAVINYIHKSVTLEQKTVENSELQESVENGSTSDLQTILGNSHIQDNILSLAVCVLLWVVPSILLVKGIKQNSRKLVAPWLYITYVSVAMNFVIFICMTLISFGFSRSLVGSLTSCLPLSFGMIFSILCIYAVRKFYKVLSIPTPILPKQCVVMEKPEDCLRYMPVFDN